MTTAAMSLVDDSDRGPERADGPHHDAAALAEILDALAERVVRYRVADRTILYCNAAWAAAHDATPAAMTGRRLDDLLGADELAGLRIQLERLGPDQPLLADDVARPAPDAPGRWVAWVDRYLPGPDGAEVVAVGRDVTDRHLAELQLAASEVRFRELAERSPDVVWRLQVKPTLRLDYLSPSIERLTGYSPAELQADIGRFRDILDAPTLALIAGAIDGQPLPPQFDVRLRGRDGRVVVVDLHVRWLPDGLQGSGRDVTELRILQAELAAQALHDPLTGLANRKLLHEVLAVAQHRATRAGSPLALIYLDLDHFKTVNDTYGHQAGDVVLRETARRLLASVGEAEVVARVGGDEFVVVHEPADEPTELLVGRISRLLSAPIDVGGGVALRCLPSIGTADTTTAGSDPNALLAAADAAMYRAKRARCATAARPSPAA